MRRHDREILDSEIIFEILRHAEYGTLSLCDGQTPYAIPMSCGFFCKDNEPWICWHGADAGKKVELLRKNPHIVYSCVSECRRDFSPERLHWSFFYRSACVSGLAEEVKNPTEKLDLLHRLLRHYGQNDTYEFPSAMIEALSIWKCRLTSWSGKQHLEPENSDK